MKLILIGLLAFVAVASAKILQTPKNSIRVAPISIFEVDNKAGNCTEDKCSENCDILTKCIGGHEIKIDCRQQTNGQRPFCNDELKQCDASNAFCPSESAGVCNLNTGIYPNLLNCRSYFYCDKDSGKRINENCLGTSVYNALTGQCEFGIQCLNFDTSTGLCKGKEGQLIVHPIKKSLYVYCINPPELEQCPNDNYEFDPLTINCKFVCKKAGRFNDAVKNIYEDKNKNIYFTECIRNGSGFVGYNSKCPKDTHFEIKDTTDDSGTCVLN